MDVFCVSFDIEKSRIASEAEMPCVLLKLHEFQRVNPHRISDGFTLSCPSAQGKNLKIPAGHQAEKSNENHWGMQWNGKKKMAAMGKIYMDICIELGMFVSAVCRGKH